MKEQIETHEVYRVVYELAHSNKSGDKMIKQVFFNPGGSIIHTSYICLGYPGFAGKKADSTIASLLKDPADFNKLGKERRTVDNMILLLQDHPGFFKEIKEITLESFNDSKFKEIQSIGFKK